MIAIRACFSAMLLLAIAGCFGRQTTTTQTQSSATTAPAPSASAEVATAGGAAATSLPVYPGAVKMSTQLARTFTYCGYKMNMTMYQVHGPSGRTVADWYAGKITNPVRINANVEGRTGAQTNTELFDPNGAYGVVVQQMIFSGQLAAAAKKYGADKTTIGIVTYDPAISSSDMQIFALAAGGDKAAFARMKAKCGSPAPQ
jgi:hypothetical protein